ncbi:MAG TPA: MBL fold metallo-hydrolase [Mycobacteriales bacterium]|nr:MBL fold metallo-hydrolase [Mycobacteriales bacterium]
MRLTVIGCSGSFPGPASPCSSYLVEADGFRVLLDLGNGALGALQRHAGLLDIDAIVLSHLHGDHCLDVCPYVVVRRYSPAGVPPRIPVLGPRGTHGRLAAAYEPTSTEGLTDVFGFGALQPGERELGPFTLRTDRVNHPVETFALRLEAGGRALTYSGDTGVSESLVRLAAGSDVLLCEASFEDGTRTPPDLHLTGREAGEHAAKAEVGRLLVTHIPPWANAEKIVTAAAEGYAGPTEQVHPDTSYDI